MSFEVSVSLSLIFSSLPVLNSDLCSVVKDDSASHQDLLNCEVLALDLRHMHR